MNITESCMKNLRQKTIKRYLKEGEDAIPIVNYDDYYITSFGRVFSSKITFEYTTLENIDYGCIVWKELKPFYCHQYKSVSLSKKGVGKKNFYIHKLVYENFYGPYNTYWWKIYFKNGDVSNCSRDNLGLRFKFKSQKKIEQYKKQQRILQVLDA